VGCTGRVAASTENKKAKGQKGKMIQNEKKTKTKKTK